MPSREEVFNIISQIRDRQDGNLGYAKDNGTSKPISDYLILLKVAIDKAIFSWAELSGEVPAVEEVKQIAAIAVHCLEEHV